MENTSGSYRWKQNLEHFHFIQLCVLDHSLTLKTILIPLIFPGEQSRCFLPAELEQLSENSSFYGSVFSQTSMKLRKESREFVSEEMSTVKSLALKIETYKNVGLRRSSCPSDCQQGEFYNSSIK